MSFEDIVNNSQGQNTSEAREKLAQEVQELVNANNQEPEIAPVVSEKEYTEVEKRAVEMGWNPEHKGRYFIDAEEYVRRAPLFERIERQSKELRELKDLVKQSTSHLTSFRKDAYDKAIRDLESQKLKAVEVGDLDGYKNVEYQTQNLKSQMQADPMINQPVEVSQNQTPPEALEFVNKHNSWYNGQSSEDRKMRALADTVDNYLVKEAHIEGRQIDVRQHLKAVENEVMRVFSHRFNNTNRDQPPAVGRSTGTRTAVKESDLVARLTPSQKEMGLKFHRSNSEYTLEKYAKDLEEIGRLNK